MFQTFVLLDELLLVLQVDIVVDIFVNIRFVEQHTDFFANRVTNYSKGVQNWDANDLF